MTTPPQTPLPPLPPDVQTAIRDAAIKIAAEGEELYTWAKSPTHEIAALITQELAPVLARYEQALMRVYCDPNESDKFLSEVYRALGIDVEYARERRERIAEYRRRLQTARQAAGAGEEGGEE